MPTMKLHRQMTSIIFSCGLKLIPAWQTLPALYGYTLSARALEKIHYDSSSQKVHMKCCLISIWAEESVQQKLDDSYRNQRFMRTF